MRPPPTPTTPPSGPSAAPIASPCVLLVMERYLPALHEAIMREGAALGWRMSFAFLPPSDPLPDLAHVDGVLALALPRKMREMASAAPDLPMVAISSDPSEFPVPLVLWDNEETGRMGARHLLDLGYRQLAFACFFDTPYGTARRKGFAEEAKRSGVDSISLDASSLGPSADYARVPRGWRENWLAGQLRSSSMPLGLMVESDFYASEAVFAARLAGLRVPQDLAIVAPCNIASDLAHSPIPISSVDLDMSEIAKQAVALLARLLAGERLPPHFSRKVPPRQVIMRESSAAFVSGRPGVADTVLYIRRNFRKQLYVGDLARRAGIPLCQLQAEIKTALGHTIRDELVSLRLDHAKKLLLETDMKVATVAIESGFGDASNMYRAFMKHGQVAPAALRGNRE